MTNKKSTKIEKIEEEPIKRKKHIELEITDVYPINGVRIVLGGAEGNVLLDFFLNTPESQQGLAPAETVRLFTTVAFLEKLNKIIRKTLKKYKEENTKNKKS